MNSVEPSEQSPRHNTEDRGNEMVPNDRLGSSEDDMELQDNYRWVVD